MILFPRVWRGLWLLSPTFPSIGTGAYCSVATRPERETDHWLLSDADFTYEYVELYLHILKRLNGVLH